MAGTKKTDPDLPVEAGSEPELLDRPRVTDDAIAETVAKLNTLARDTVLNMALEMGRIVVEDIYDGDLDAWRSKGVKDTSYRKLAEHSDLAISPAGLSRACGLYELCEREGVSTLEHLTASHGYEVLGLPSAKQKRLLADARKKSWSVAELREQAKKARTKDGRGRPPLPGFEKSLNRMAKLLESPEESFGGLDEEHLGKLDAEKALQLYQTATGMKLQLEALQEALKTRVPGFAPSE